jgi:hypothetical protein
MNELDMYYRAEMQYRTGKLRNAIVGGRERKTLKARRRRPLGTGLVA